MKIWVVSFFLVVHPILLFRLTLHAAGVSPRNTEWFSACSKGHKKSPKFKYSSKVSWDIISNQIAFIFYICSFIALSLCDTDQWWIGALPLTC